MRSFLQRCSDSDGKYLINIWNIISFLCLSVSEQFARAGSTQEYFMKDKRVGKSNYIYGLIRILNESGGANHFKYSADENDEFNKIISKLSRVTSTDFWTENSLENNTDWKKICDLSKIILNKNDLHENPPKQYVATQINPRNMLLVKVT